MHKAAHAIAHFFDVGRRVAVGDLVRVRNTDARCETYVGPLAAAEVGFVAESVFDGSAERDEARMTGRDLIEDLALDEVGSVLAAERSSRDALPRRIERDDSRSVPVSKDRLATGRIRLAVEP